MANSELLKEAASLHKSSRSAIVGLLVADGEASTSELSELTGISTNNLSHHLRENLHPEYVSRVGVDDSQTRGAQHAPITWKLTDKGKRVGSAWRSEVEMDDVSAEVERLQQEVNQLDARVQGLEEYKPRIERLDQKIDTLIEKIQKAI